MTREEKVLTPEQLVTKLHDVWARKSPKSTPPDTPTLVYRPCLLMPSGQLYPLGNAVVPMKQIIDLRARVKELEGKG